MTPGPGLAKLCHISCRCHLPNDHKTIMDNPKQRKVGVKDYPSELKNVPQVYTPNHPPPPQTQPKGGNTCLNT